MINPDVAAAASRWWACESGELPPRSSAAEEKNMEDDRDGNEDEDAGLSGADADASESRSWS
jgi:hypothetical protein